MRQDDESFANVEGNNAVKTNRTRLGRRSQKKNETLKEYLYILMEIAKPIELEDENLIEYFVNGLPDSRTNKALLFQAKTMRQLKVQIVAYEKMRGSSK